MTVAEEKSSRRNPREMQFSRHAGIIASVRMPRRSTDSQEDHFLPFRDYSLHFYRGNARSSSTSNSWKRLRNCNRGDESPELIRVNGMPLLSSLDKKKRKKETKKKKEPRFMQM